MQPWSDGSSIVGPDPDYPEGTHLSLWLHHDLTKDNSLHKLGFIKQVDKGWITTVKDLESWRFEYYAPVNVKPPGGEGDPGRFDSISFPVGEEWLKIWHHTSSRRWGSLTKSTGALTLVQPSWNYTQSSLGYQRHFGSCFVWFP